MGTGAVLEGHGSRVPRVLWQWEHGVRESGDNRTRKGRQYAEEVARLFVRWFVSHPNPVPTSVDIYGWMAEAQKHERWRYGRCTRALVSRVVHAALCVLQYPRLADIDRTDQHHGRCMSGVELAAWMRELHACREPRPDDAQDLWNAYVHEWGAECSTATTRSRREKLRRWRRYVSQHAPSIVRPPTDKDCVGCPCLSPLPVDPYIRFFAPVRWIDHDHVLELFASMRRIVVERLQPHHPRRARTLLTYIRPFYHVCCAVVPATGGALIPALDGLNRTACIQALAHHGQLPPRNLGRCIRAIFQFTNGGPWGSLLPTWASWPAILRSDLSMHPPKRKMRSRDRFTDEELERLKQATANSPMDHGLLLFFLHTGCLSRLQRKRTNGKGPKEKMGACPCSGASCNLRVVDIMQVEQVMRSSGRVEEKGGYVREFDIDPILSKALYAAVQHNRGSPYVFPAFSHGYYYYVLRTLAFPTGNNRLTVERGWSSFSQSSHSVFARGLLKLTNVCSCNGFFGCGSICMESSSSSSSAFLFLHKNDITSSMVGASMAVRT